MDNFIYDDYSYPAGSSVVKAIFYSTKSQRLVIQFTSDSFQGYENVENDEYISFVTASSHGAHYNKYFRGSVKHPPFKVDKVVRQEYSSWNDTPGNTVADAKEFTVVLKIKAVDIVDAATKVHGFTSDPFTVVSIGQS